MTSVVVTVTPVVNSSFLSTVGAISDIPTQLAGPSCNNGTELAIATTALSGRLAHKYGEF